jgi:predicted  nucleic acid-binding Zn-ribbon protein
VSSSLEELLTLQERDLTLDRLQLRFDTLPVRDAVAQSEARASTLLAQRAGVQARRDEVAREEQRFDDEARALDVKAKDVETKMYSGEVTSPRELQAMQADIDQLRRHQRDVENRELESMEVREPLDGELAALQEQLDALATELVALRATLAESEAELQVELGVERDARAGIARGLDADLVAAYEQRRSQAGGTGAAGAARLVGNTCQGCHLSIPSTEVERIKRAPEGTIAFCDNCGCILVP